MDVFPLELSTINLLVSTLIPPFRLLRPAVVRIPPIVVLPLAPSTLKVFASFIVKVLELAISTLSLTLRVPAMRVLPVPCAIVNLLVLTLKSSFDNIGPLNVVFTPEVPIAVICACEGSTDKTWLPPELVRVSPVPAKFVLR